MENSVRRLLEGKEITNRLTCNVDLKCRLVKWGENQLLITLAVKCLPKNVGPCFIPKGHNEWVRQFKNVFVVKGDV